MADNREILISALLIDPKNARLRDEQPNQQAALLALAQQQGPKLLSLARDIVSRKRLDPLSLLAVVESPDQAGFYIVLEGNRRIATLKGLETPSLVVAGFDKKGQREWAKLSQAYAATPIATAPCAVFDDERDALEWIALRHDGESGGKGIVAWGADEKDRFRSRHGGRPRSPAGQVIDFVESQGMLSEQARASNRGIISTVERMLSSKPIRDVLGIDIVGGQVVMHHPADQVARSLTHVVEELRTGALRVGRVYDADQRATYAAAFPAEHRPDPNRRLPAAVALGHTPPDAAAANASGKGGGGRKTKVQRPAPPRPTVVPKDCRLTIPQTRLEKVYQELRDLELERFSNAISVLLRVFLELSMDHYVKAHKITVPTSNKGQLAAKIHAVVDDLLQKGSIDKNIELTMKRHADGGRVLAASVVTFNQFVHSFATHPAPIDLRAAWDDMQPFLEKVWP